MTKPAPVNEHQAAAANRSNVLEDAQILASRIAMDGSAWHLGLWESLRDETVHDMLEDLAERSSYPNVFFENGYLQSSSDLIARHKVQFLFLTETYGETTTLRFFAPVTSEKTGPFSPRYLRIWSSEFAPLGHPLIDGEDVEHVVDTLLHLFNQTDRSAACGILFNSLPKNSAFTRCLFKRNDSADRFTFFNHYERAALLPPGETGYAKKHLSGKRRQRLNAAKRKLEQLGDVKQILSSRSPEIEVALLDFLYLEKRGWKGRRNTALACHDETRQLAMDVVAELASAQKCEIHTTYLDDNAIASMILLKSGGHYISWKIAFDEAYASYSVGNLLTVHATSLISERDDFKLLDSVAVGDNETANRFWPDRLPLCSLAIGFGERSAYYSKQIALNLSLAMRARRGLRKLIKR